MTKKDDVKAAVKEAEEKVTKTVKDVTKSADKTAKAVKATADEAAKTVKSTADETAKTVKSAAKKTAKTAKTTAKKAVNTAAAKITEAKTEVIIQYQNNEVDIVKIKERVKAQFIAEGHKPSTIKDISIYVKPEDYSAYYVVNGKFSGRVDLF